MDKKDIAEVTNKLMFEVQDLMRAEALEAIEGLGTEMNDDARVKLFHMARSIQMLNQTYNGLSSVLHNVREAGDGRLVS